MSDGTLMGEHRQAQSRRAATVENTAALAFAFIAIVALKWPLVEQPPAWDEAFSVHPAAITLARNGFDLWALLGEPTYAKGGPNTHAASIVTLGTAAAYRWLADGSRRVLEMHLCHFAVAAFCLMAAYRFSRAVFDRPLAIVFAAAVFCYPLFHAQAGMMYLEIPLLACTLSALTAWSNRRRKAAVAWALVAVLVKETGVIVAGTLAVAALLERRSWPARFWWAALASMVPGLPLLAELCLFHSAIGEAHHRLPYWTFLRHHFAARVFQVPDLCALFMTFLFVGCLRWRTVWRGLTSARADTSDESDPWRATWRLGLAHLTVAMFVAFYLSVPLVGENYLLPRYFVQIIPLVFLGLLEALRQATSRRTACLVALACCGLFLVNRWGLFYPRGAYNDFSVAERSEAYRDLLAVQRAGVRAIAETPPDVPVFYGLPEHYLTRYPAMGYVSVVPPNGHCVELEVPYNLGRLADFPEHFFMLYDYAFLGGRQIQSLVKQAANDPGREVRVAGEFSKGDYQVVLFEVRPRTSRRDSSAGRNTSRGQE